jgi:hypothetical protein
MLQLDVHLSALVYCAYHTAPNSSSCWLCMCTCGVHLVLQVHAQLPVGTVTTTLAEVAEGVFFQAFTNESVTEILVTPNNFVLSKDAW